MSKLAILFFGKHYCKQYYNPINEIYIDIDYRNSIENYKKYIYDYFQQFFHQIDTYICTDDSPVIDQLVSDYRPIKTQLINNGYRNQKIISAIDLCLTSGVQYDNVLITRLDLLFKKTFDTVNIDYSTINIVSQLEGSAIDDNLYILPFDKLELFRKIVISTKNSHLHWIKDKIIRDFKKINYLYNEPGKIVKNLIFYDIVRNITKK